MDDDCFWRAGPVPSDAPHNGSWFLGVERLRQGVPGECVPADTRSTGGAHHPGGR